jgi:hypothetical protein
MCVVLSLDGLKTTRISKLTISLLVVKLELVLSSLLVRSADIVKECKHPTSEEEKDE